MTQGVRGWFTQIDYALKGQRHLRGMGGKLPPSHGAK